MAEVGKLANVFSKYAGTANHISKVDFLKVMKNHMPGLVTNDEQLVEKIFKLADPVRAPPPPLAPSLAACHLLVFPPPRLADHHAWSLTL